VLELALAVLAALINGYGVLLAVSLWRVRWRARHHTGVYGVEGLDASFGTADDARAAATEAVRRESLPQPARVLAEREDGGWDVIDEIHVLG
jgi:hypothetical protein